VQEVTIFEAHASYVLDLQFSHNSRTLISAGMDSVMVCIELGIGKG
jgi:hypothetical protein